MRNSQACPDWLLRGRVLKIGSGVTLPITEEKVVGESKADTIKMSNRYHDRESLIYYFLILLGYMLFDILRLLINLTAFSLKYCVYLRNTIHKIIIVVHDY